MLSWPGYSGIGNSRGKSLLPIWSATPFCARSSNISVGITRSTNDFSADCSRPRRWSASSSWLLASRCSPFCRACGRRAGKGPRRGGVRFWTNTRPNCPSCERQNTDAHLKSQIAAPGDGRTPIVLAGPTAVGKSAVAIALAAAIGGEIISVESMQVYRGLDIGTAKPSAAERSRLPHHLLDVADLSEEFDAAQFVRLAKLAVEGIRARGKRPIFCGGTGLYFKAFFEGLGKAPSGNPELRRELEASPLEELLKELALADPETFQQIDRRNPRRVIRALEVCRTTGKRFSAQRAAWSARGVDAESGWAEVRAFGFARANPVLRQRIEQRVDDMFARGLVTETEDLMRRGLEKNRTAMQALGYRQVAEHLRGKRSLSETISLVKTRTWQFARRQMTWFRHQMPLEWIEIAEG